MVTTSPPTSNPEPKLVTRVRARRATFKARGRLYRGAFMVAGFVLVLGGLAMILLPGDDIPLVPFV